jgi:hypothetical protein
MPILLVFALTAACVPVKWWPPVAGGGEETAVTFTAAAVTFSLLAAFTLRTWVVRTLRRSPARKGEVAAVYARLRRVMFFVNVGLVALCVLAFGWGWFVRENLVVAGETDPTHGGPLLLPFAELAVPLPSGHCTAPPSSARCTSPSSAGPATSSTTSGSSPCW